MQVSNSTYILGTTVHRSMSSRDPQKPVLHGIRAKNDRGPIAQREEGRGGGRSSRSGIRQSDTPDEEPCTVRGVGTKARREETSPNAKRGMSRQRKGDNDARG